MELGYGRWYDGSDRTIEGCFQGSLFEKVYIGRTLLYRKDTVNLNSSPFYGNKYLKHVTLGGSFTTIDEYMFCECDALESITSLHITPPTLGDNNFTVKQYVNVQLRVPQEAISAYQSADNWKNFWDVQPIESSGIEISKAIPTSHPTKIYDLFGRKLSNPQKGVNIINGKKILIK